MITVSVSRANLSTAGVLMGGVVVGGRGKEKA